MVCVCVYKKNLYIICFLVSKRKQPTKHLMGFLLELIKLRGSLFTVFKPRYILKVGDFPKTSGGCYSRR